ncbi:hypothetical protein [uncultured Aeromicrobium sp.]|uniref:hypothetical protein n=1 Tax=uncultured Aeromicrobium sp. TaxID=337820 RepID=UPI0025F86E17|nr:hypothetical protein [uncultured Aeromicrobium sp.]
MTDNIEARLAPDLDRSWAEEFILEARLRDVPGERIGDALMEVNAHCRDAGETAWQAFGDPASYAREIAAGQPVERTRWLHLLGPTMVQVVGVVLTLSGMGAWMSDATVTVTWGMVTMLALICLEIVTLALVLDHTLSAIVRRPFLAAAVGAGAAALLTAGAAALLLIKVPIVELPFSVVLGTGVAVLAAGLAAELSARPAAPPDPIRAPGTADESGSVWNRLPWTSITSLAWVALGVIVIALLGGR